MNFLLLLRLAIFLHHSVIIINFNCLSLASFSHWKINKQINWIRRFFTCMSLHAHLNRRVLSKRVWRYWNKCIMPRLILELPENYGPHPKYMQAKKIYGRQENTWQLNLGINSRDNSGTNCKKYILMHAQV